MLNLAAMIEETRVIIGLKLEEHILRRHGLQ